MTPDKWITAGIAVVAFGLGIIRPIYLEIDALEVKAKADVKDLRSQQKEDEAFAMKLFERVIVVEQQFVCKK